MKDNDVWALVELPPNARIVGSKWLFKKKTDMDGAVYIFKARLVAKGFTQTYGVDYEETFSPVVDIRAIRILIAIATYYDYEIWQMDVKTAFLNGHLFEEVYMEQPEGFVNPKYPNHVCKLKRSIYGLKQALRKWNKRFDDEIKKFAQAKFPIRLACRIIMYYAVRCTRPDVAFAQNMTSRFQQNLGEEHWTAVKIILKYVRNTKDMFLVYGGNMNECAQSLLATLLPGYLFYDGYDNLKCFRPEYVFNSKCEVLLTGKVQKQSNFLTTSSKVAESIAAI
ncbi:retrovirus-related pol polyprotein from transposon TNT 1-94 [Tanacetum coccineum]